MTEFLGPPMNKAESNPQEIGEMNIFWGAQGC